jgi:hypothetical protein
LDRYKNKMKSNRNNKWLEISNNNNNNNNNSSNRNKMCFIICKHSKKIKYKSLYKIIDVVLKVELKVI